MTSGLVSPDATDRPAALDLVIQTAPLDRAEPAAGPVSATERPRRSADAGRDALRAELLALLDGPALLFPDVG